MTKQRTRADLLEDLLVAVRPVVTAVRRQPELVRLIQRTDSLLPSVHAFGIAAHITTAHISPAAWHRLVKAVLELDAPTAVDDPKEAKELAEQRREELESWSLQEREPA
jgi:hypothetical protein